MEFPDLIFSVTPSFIENRIHILKEKWRLNKVEQQNCKLKNLRAKKTISLQNLFSSSETEEIWEESQKKVKAFRIDEAEGGINPGDRKAVYYLINRLKPSSVLEVGTHIGASTVYIASSLNSIQHEKKAALTTVDVINVNSRYHKQWLDYGVEYSPLEMVKRLNLDSIVNFVTDSSINFANNCEKKFDFIFLDGNHQAEYVYQEIPKILKLLNENGIILLHDYFPDLKPLWSNNKVLPGPFLAVERLINEGANLIAVPLGELPWPTKLGSNISSLALLMQDN